MTQRPTTLRLFATCCPMAVQHYEDGTPQDRSIFAVGTAAHDVLHALAVDGLPAVESVVAALLTTGREGVDAEPPLHPDPVFAGRDLALAHYERSLGSLGTEKALYELGLAVAADWETDDYNDDPWLRARLDVLDVATQEDEEFFAEGWTCRDYKTAWSAGEKDLDSIQMKAQAVLALAHRGRLMRIHDYPEPSFIRREIVNLRSGKTHAVDVWLDAEGMEVIEGWKRDLATTVRAASAMPRIAAPGVNCHGCPYAMRCPPALDFVGDHRASVPERYAAAAAVAAALQAEARAACDGGFVTVPGGRVGTVPTTSKEIAPDALVKVWEAWTAGEATDEGTTSLVRRFLGEIKPGATQLDKASRLLMPERKQKAERDAFMAQFTVEKAGRRFGVWPDADAAHGDSEAPEGDEG